MVKNQECLCPHCEIELKKNCSNSEFCKPCFINKYKICHVCGAEYLSEYDKCPACTVAKR
ncbi:MAG: hypothetical protein LBJ68_01720 [Endomicrobium sp.]|jgi:hypothetical protein|nr:hypothetical protein [Endomicrobium sp.]